MAANDNRTRDWGKAATGRKAQGCNVCGRASEEEICAQCADRIRAEALVDVAGEAPRARVKPGPHPIQTQPKRPLR